MNFFAKRKMKALRKKVQKARDQTERGGGKNADVKNEITAQLELAKFYEKHYFDKDLPKAEVYALECYRAAAILGDVKAQFICGQRLLDQAKFWDVWSRSPIYGLAIHKKYAAGLYEEAFSFLRSAETNEYPFAKRLLGMIHIHGWGMTPNLDLGYQLVLDSIDQEKAWDRATKIFDELKLNSPQFFAALQSRKRP